MVEGKRTVLRKDRSSCERICHLPKGKQRVIKRREKDGAAFDKQAEIVVGSCVEQRSTDEGLHQSCSLLDQHGGLVSPQQLVLPDDGNLHLLEEVCGDR